MHLLGFRFAPRIRDLADKRLYIHGDAKRYPTLARLIGGSVNVKRIRAHWDAILRLAASIQQGTVTASLMLRKLGSYPRQNGLALALRELGPHRAHSVHARLAARHRVAPPGTDRFEQGRGQECAGPRRVLQPAG